MQITKTYSFLKRVWRDAVGSAFSVHSVADAVVPVAHRPAPADGKVSILQARDAQS